MGSHPQRFTSTVKARPAGAVIQLVADWWVSRINLDSSDTLTRMIIIVAERPVIFHPSIAAVGGAARGRVR